MVLFIKYVVLTFESVDEILWCYTIQMKTFWWNFCIVLFVISDYTKQI